MENIEEKEIRHEKPHRKWWLTPAQTVVFAFFAVIMAGAFFLALPISNRNGKWLGFVDALFLATSGISGAGLTVVTLADAFNGFGQAIMYILIQIGGLGIMMLSSLVMILIGRKLTLKDRLVLQEALNRNEMQGVVRLVRLSILSTLIIEGVGALIMMPALILQNGPIGIWQSFFTAASSFCNAGFDIVPMAVTPTGNACTAFVFNVSASISIMLMCVLGGVGFVVISDVLHCKCKIGKFTLHTKVVLLANVGLFIVGFILFVAIEWNNALADLNGGTKILASLFQSISVRNTCGYGTVDVTKMHPSTRIIFMLLMFVGASPCSTGGGIKTTTFVLLVCMLVSGFKGRDDIVLMKRNIRAKNAYKAVSVVVLSFIVVMGLTAVLALTERNTLADTGLYRVEYLMFEAFNAFSTTGLSAGITPYLSSAGRIAVTLVMFFGRVGPVTIGMMFVSKNGSDLLRYPDGSLMIG